MLDGSAFSTRGAYCSLQTALHDTDAERVWNSKVPAKVKVFGWLLLLDRINTRANLHHKHILDYTNCPRCPATIEDQSHLFFTCPRAALIWQRLGITHSAQPFECFWDSPSPPGLPRNIWDYVLLIILWKIWDARNAMVFRKIDQTCTVTISNIIQDLTLWSHRFRTTETREAADLWRDHLTLCNM